MQRWVGLLFLLVASLSAAADIRVGVYYFPGWKNDQKGNARSQPWEVIKPYPGREPLLGWYAEDDPGVMAQQLKWMHDYGLDYVVFNWLWGSDGRPYLAHGVNAYLQSSDRYGVDFSILWSNHTDYLFSRTQFRELFEFWVKRYFFRSDYLKIDGKPVVFIFSAEILNKNAEHLGMTSAQLISMADGIARQHGLTGVAFVGGVGANHGKGFDYSSNSGYAAWSAYNFHGPARKAYDSMGRRMSHSFEELDYAYQDHWSWMIEKASNQYIVPMTSGWDKRPWGGSRDAAHDNSRANAQEFLAHLKAAKDVIAANPQKTRNMGVICCWNEFGEGSFIEPTKVDRFRLLDSVKSVFGRN